MMRITIEMIPGGDEAKAQTLGVAEITNLGTGDHDLGNYEVLIFKSRTYSTTAGIWKRARVFRFPRSSRRLGPWDLLFRALRGAVGDRNR